MSFDTFGAELGVGRFDEDMVDVSLCLAAVEVQGNVIGGISGVAMLQIESTAFDHGGDVDVHSVNDHGPGRKRKNNQLFRSQLAGWLVCTT